MTAVKKALSSPHSQKQKMFLHHQFSSFDDNDLRRKAIPFVFRRINRQKSSQTSNSC